MKSPKIGQKYVTASSTDEFHRNRIITITDVYPLANRIEYQYETTGMNSWCSIKMLYENCVEIL